jgi:hypothetical protein
MVVPSVPDRLATTLSDRSHPERELGHQVLLAPAPATTYRYLHDREQQSSECRSIFARRVTDPTPATGARVVPSQHRFSSHRRT